MTTSSPDTVQDGVVVLLHYVLRDGDGDVIDRSDPAHPMPYLQGAHNIVPGLEAALEGQAKGARHSVTVPPEQGYGLRQTEAPTPVPRTAFPEDVAILAGMTFVEEQEDGEHVPVWVSDVDDETVYVDYDHPLAGVTLHFEVEVVDLRAASEDELAHGHPHGWDGTHTHDHDHGED